MARAALILPRFEYMKNYIYQVVGLLISSVLLASCASTETDPGLGRDINYRGSDCISIRTIRDYTPLDNRSLLIEAGGKRHYYVQLVVSSFDMRSSIQMGSASRDDWLCPYGGDALVFGSFGDERVGIRSISRISEEQAEELLIRHGIREPDEQDTDPAPAELAGAEVEELG